MKDKRFEKSETDPRFRAMPKREKLVPVDARFSKMFTNKEDFENMEGLYFQEEKEDQNAKNQEEASFDEEKEEKYIVEGEAVESEDDAELGEQTSTKLAVQNYDWQNIKAEDLASLMQGLAKEVGGSLVKVQVFASAFGKERLEEEKIHGPQRALKAAFGGREPNQAALKKYELERLKYFFAIATFDSRETATKVYDQFDDMELEHSGCRLDLRFVPEDLTPPHLEAEALPQQVKELPDFETKVKSHSNVDLTWDAPLKKNTAELYDRPLEELDREKIKDLVGSDEDDEEDEALAKALRKEMLNSESVFKDFRKGGDKSIDIKFKAGFKEHESDHEESETDEKREFISGKYRKSRNEMIRAAKEKKALKQNMKKQEEELGLLVNNEESGQQKAFVADKNDPRFSRKNEPAFAVDPTFPKFNSVQRENHAKAKKIKK